MDSRAPSLTRFVTGPLFHYCRKSWKPRLMKTLCSSNRPPNRPDGRPPASPSSEGGPSAEGAPGQTSRSVNGGEQSPTRTGEPDQTPRRRVPSSPFDSLGVFQTRTIFNLPRRISSGYFSFDSDSMPNSPLSPSPPTIDIATQTPSQSGQVMLHALERMAESFGEAGARAPQRHGEHTQPAVVPMEAGKGMLVVPLLPQLTAATPSSADSAFFSFFFFLFLFSFCFCYSQSSRCVCPVIVLIY